MAPKSYSVLLIMYIVESHSWDVNNIATLDVLNLFCLKQNLLNNVGNFLEYDAC
jgi:hypothetical protein